MSTNYGFEPTLDGLNNIDSDSTTTNNIICNTLLVNTTANAPTVAPSSNDTSVATTAWVTTAVAGLGSTYVDIASTQTITGQKTFNNANTYINNTLNTSAIINSGQASAGSIMTNTYNPFLATNDVNMNPTQTSGSLNLGTKIDRSGIIQIGNGVNATCDIRIGTARTTGGTVSMGSNSSIANTLNLQSALINVGTGSPVGTANTINIGNGNNGSTLTINNDTTINRVSNNRTTTINTPVNTNQISLKCADGGLTINNNPSNISGLGPTLFYCNTITTPINNQQNLIYVTIPFCIQADGGPTIYTGGTMTINYTGTTVSVLKNGVAFATPTAVWVNQATATPSTRVWNAPNTGIKGPIYTACYGNLQIAVPLSTSNASADSYQVGLTIGATYTYTGTPSLTFGLYGVTTGNANFTFTQANNDGETFASTNPPASIAPAITIGNTSQNEITSNANLLISTAPSSDLLLTAGGAMTLTAVTQTTNATTEIRQNIGGVAKIQCLTNTTTVYGGTALELWSNAIQRVRITNTGIQFNSYQFNNFGVYPVGSASATGYFTSTTTATKGTVANINLASITIGAVPGCYLIEGGFSWSGAGTAQAYTGLSLSTTSVTFDATRQQVFYQGGVAGGYGNRMSSIFNVNAATTFYLIMQVPTAVGAGTVQSNYLSLTKIA